MCVFSVLFPLCKREMCECVCVFMSSRCDTRACRQTRLVYYRSSLAFLCHSSMERGLQTPYNSWIKRGDSSLNQSVFLIN